MKREITLRDIGKQLGLSAMTVSLALRDSSRISDATKRRVRTAVRNINFVPNQLARALATGRSNLIGVIVPNSSDLYYAEVIRAIEDAASANRFHVLLCNGSYRMQTYTARVRDMRRLHMNGIIAAPPFTAERPRLPQFWKDLSHSDFKVVLINRQLDPPIFHQVAADYMAGVDLVAAALAERGHRRVAYISGEPEVLPFRQRLEVFRRCVRDCGFERDDALFERGALTAAGGYEACRRLWKANRRKPTAIVASNDTSAVGVLRYLDDVGARVPGDVSIASFDGTPFADFMHCSLTTVVTPMYDIGRQAFRTLL
ncbi:MAG: LacI family DNA-binding transcriptional regulator, partial [Acidobacteriota bacterium]